jgi:hypothetical protein
MPTTITATSNFSIYQNPSTYQIYHTAYVFQTEITNWPVTIINGNSPMNIEVKQC